MSSVNKVIILGYVGGDPEIKTTTAGLKMANFSVATTEKWKDKNTGEVKSNTEWHRIVCFDSLASIVEQYVRKGTQLYIEGKLQTRKWQGNDGVERYTTEIVLNGFGGRLVMVGSGNKSGGSGGGGGTKFKEKPILNQGTNQGADGFFDDDIPFN